MTTYIPELDAWLWVSGTYEGPLPLEGHDARHNIVAYDGKPRATFNILYNGGRTISLDVWRFTHGCWVYETKGLPHLTEEQRAFAKTFGVEMP